MDTHTYPGKAPRYESDGFRDERCARCGEVIGFAHFDAREYVIGGSIAAGFEIVHTFVHRGCDEWKENAR